MCKDTANKRPPSKSGVKKDPEYVEIILKKKVRLTTENEVSPLNFSRFVDREI